MADRWLFSELRRPPPRRRPPPPRTITAEAWVAACWTAPTHTYIRCAVAVFMQPALLMTTIDAIASAAWRLTVFCQED